MCFKFFRRLSFAFNYFIVSGMFLILLLFISCSTFFIISVNSSGLFFMYIEKYAKGSSWLF